MCNDEKWIDREVKSLKKEGHIVEKRKLKNKDFKFGIYLKQTKK